MTPYRRNLFAVIATMAGVTFSHSLAFPLLSLLMQRHGFDSALIGLNTSIEALAVLAVAPFAPALLRRFGTSGLMLGAIALRLASFLVLPLLPDPTLWFVPRFFMGAGASLIWIVSEAWINEVVAERVRGRVLAAYSMAVAAGYALGPLALAQIGAQGWTPFLAGAAVLGLAMLTTLVAHGHAPRLDGARGAALPAYFRLAPLVMLCCFTVSALDNTLVTFLPLYGPNLGLPAKRALYLLTVLGLGGIALQYPVGWLADRMDRRLLTLAIAGAMFCAGLALPQALSRAPLDLVFMFVLGGLIGSLYTMGNVLLGERFRGGDLAAASTLFAVMWSLGGLAGPPSGGLGLDLAPVYGLPAAICLLVLPILPLAAGAYLRHHRRPGRP